MFEAAKEERKNAAVQLHQMQEEFAALLDDRDSGLKRSEATTQQTESCRRLLENAQKVRTLELKNQQGPFVTIRLHSGIPTVERTSERRSRAVRRHQPMHETFPRGHYRIGTGAANERSVCIAAETE